MTISNPFQTVLEGLLEDLLSNKRVNSSFSQQIREMQGNIQNRIQGRGAIDSFRRLRNAEGTAPVFSPQPRSRPDPNNPPAISDPRFRPDIPADPFAVPKQTQKARPVDTKLAQAGPATMTDAPSTKPLQASPELVSAVIQAESNGDPNALSPKGAIGLMQIMPSTAAKPGFGMPSITVEELRDPIKNVRWGTDRLSKMLARYNGDTRRALIAYNAGHTVADRFTGDLSSLPTETQNYVAKIEAALGIEAGPAAPVTPTAPGPPGTPAVAPLDIPVPATGAQEPVAPQAPSVARRRAPPRQPPASVGPPAMAQGETPPPVQRQASVPVIWQQAVTKFLQSRDPADLSVVPNGAMPVILALMGQAARGTR